MLNRNLIIIFLLSMSSLACATLFYFSKETTNAVIGMIVGISLGVATCVYVKMSNILLMGVVILD